jgi:hypothetical protein
VYVFFGSLKRVQSVFKPAENEATIHSFAMGIIEGENTETPEMVANS